MSIGCPRDYGDGVVPMLSGVYDKLNVIIGGEVRGLRLAPGHFALMRDLYWQTEPCEAASVIIVSSSRSMTVVEAVAAGVAMLEAPYYGVPSQGMIGDVHVWTEDGLMFTATNRSERPDRAG